MIFIFKTEWFLRSDFSATFPTFIWFPFSFALLCLSCLVAGFLRVGHCFVWELFFYSFWKFRGLPWPMTYLILQCLPSPTFLCHAQGSSPDFLSCFQLSLPLRSECLGSSGLPGSHNQLTLLCLFALPPTQMWLLECIFAAGDVSTLLLIFWGSCRLLG